MYENGICFRNHKVADGSGCGFGAIALCSSSGFFLHFDTDVDCEPCRLFGILRCEDMEFLFSDPCSIFMANGLHIRE